jgi:SpoIID/LytB domain protein
MAANFGKHGAAGFDLCDQTHCQVMRTATPETERAAQATKGKVLLYEGEPASIFYSASCGGHTERPSAVWPGADDPPFLPARPDEGCGGAPAWSSQLALGDLERSLRAAGFKGHLRDVRVEARTGSGRAATLQLDGLTPNRISGQDLRAAVGGTLGWQHIRSTAFNLQRRSGRLRFTGQGNGHGVGMCVIGSMQRAAAGESSDAILARYFPGTTISPMPARSAVAGAPDRPGAAQRVRLEIPERYEAERQALTDRIATARNELAAALGVEPPSQLVVRFHASPAGYERATGLPWFTSGTLVDDQLHFVPVDALRDRGLLDRSLRHELVHLMSARTLAQRPAWVREGAAVHFADPDAPLPPRGECPGDIELLQPVSIGALADAYARARACFVQQLSAGRSWQEVR